jgi:hypothetical protein
MSNIPDDPYGLTIYIRHAFGGEQSFRIVFEVDRDSRNLKHILKFRMNGPLYESASGQVHLSQEQVEAIYTLLEEVCVGPIPIDPELWLDGETTTVTIRHGQNRVELEYSHPPKPWIPLAKLVEMVRELAKRADEEHRVS